MSLSKTRVVQGLRCSLDLWRRVHTPDAPELAKNLTPAVEMLMNLGNTVGEKARTVLTQGQPLPGKKRTWGAAPYRRGPAPPPPPPMEWAERKSVLIEGAKDGDFSAAVAATQAALADAETDVIYEAAFVRDGVFVAVDALVRNRHAETVRDTLAADSDDAADGESDAGHRGGPLWDVVEVKASTRVKDGHVVDCAVQWWALQEQVQLADCYVLHLNKAAEAAPSGLMEDTLKEVFTPAHVTDKVLLQAGSMGAQVAHLQQVLANTDAAPEVPMGKQCKAGHKCAFFQTCTLQEQPIPLKALESPADEAGPWAAHVSHLSRPQTLFVEMLKRKSCAMMYDIPDHFVNKGGLSRTQQLQRETALLLRKNGFALSHDGSAKGIEPMVVRKDDLRAALDGLRGPIAHLDFESCQPAIPPFPGTHPLQHIPVQLSVHTEVAPPAGHAAAATARTHGNDATPHYQYGFLPDTAGVDPRRGLAEALLEATAGANTILAWSKGFENSMITHLAAQHPDLAPDLREVQAKLVDLLPIVRHNVAHAKFLGSYSIKSVLPVLVPSLSYADLDGIANGTDASFALSRIITGDAAEPELSQMRTQLLEYCAMDTWAMVVLLRRLKELAA